MNILDNKKFKEELMSLLIYLEETKGVKLNKTKEEFINNIVKKVYQILDEYQDLLQGIEEEDIFQEVYENLLKIGQYDNNQIIDIFEKQFMINLKITIERYIFKSKYIYIPDNGIILMHRYIKVLNKLTKSLGRIPYIEEIADELQEDIHNIIIIDKIYNHYKYGNFTNELFDDTIFYSTQDESEYLIKDSIINLLYTSKLTSKELCIVLLAYGLTPPNQNIIYYNGIKVILDGIPKKAPEIASMLGVTHQSINIILRRALLKLEIKNKNTNEYALDIEFAKKLQLIYSYINVRPYTDRFPNFYSFFEEYTEDEIKEVLNKLNIDLILLNNEFTIFNKRKSKKYYDKPKVMKLYSIIKKVYLKLIEVYGKRKMNSEGILKENPSINYFEQQNIDGNKPKIPNKHIYLFEKVKNLFDYISNGDILTGIYLITKLDNDERKILHQIYGSDLNRILEPQESLKHDNLTFEKFNAILIKLKKLFDDINNEKNIGNDEIKIIEKILIEKKGKGKGIYKILEYFGTPSAINKTLELLFNEELELLKKVFGETLEDNNYLDNFYKLSKINQAIFSNILTFIKNNIKPRKYRTTANITTIKKKVYTFYEMFFCNGYSLDDINNVFEKHIDKIYEYFDNSTNQNKRIEIVTFLSNELDRESSIAPSEIKRVNVNTLRLSPTYNRIVSNIKAKSA